MFLLPISQYQKCRKRSRGPLASFTGPLPPHRIDVTISWLIAIFLAGLFLDPGRARQRVMGWILLWWGLLDSYLDREKVRRRIDGDRVLLCILQCHKRCANLTPCPLFISYLSSQVSTHDVHIDNITNLLFCTEHYTSGTGPVYK